MTTNKSTFRPEFEILKKRIAEKDHTARPFNYILEFFGDKQDDFIFLAKNKFYLIYKDNKKIAEIHQTFQPFCSSFQTAVYGNGNFWIYEADSNSIWRQQLTDRVPERFINLKKLNNNQAKHLNLKIAFNEKFICFQSRKKLVVNYVYKNRRGWTDFETTFINLERSFLKQGNKTKRKSSGDKYNKDLFWRFSVFGKEKEYVCFYKSSKGVRILINKFKVPGHKNRKVELQPLILYEHNDPRNANPNFKFEEIEFCPKTNHFFFTTKYRESGILINVVKIDMERKKLIKRRIVDTGIANSGHGYYKMNCAEYKDGKHYFIFYKTKSKNNQNIKIFSYDLRIDTRETQEIKFQRKSKIMLIKNIEGAVILMDSNLDLTKLSFF